jgi:WD40 repeat protein
MEKIDKKQLFQDLAQLMNSNKSDFHLILDNLGTLYKKKYKKCLVIRPTDSSAIDGNKPQHFYDSLKLIEDWIQKCIDEIKVYLKPICYPLFVYLYLRLLKHNPDEAHHFLSENREKYKAFNDEIDQLALCQNINPNNPLINKYFTGKAHIFIPNEIFNFFIHFLNTEGLILIVEILNDHFERSNLLSKMSQSEEERNKFLLLNNSSEDIEKINSRTQIYYNKVNKDIIDNLVKGKSKRHSDSLLSKIIIPFPENSNEFINVEDNCLKINKTSPPTIGCFTLLNTNNKLNCIDMTNDGGIIACGFKSGEIIVWVLDKNINIEITYNSLKELEPYKNKDIATLIKNQIIQNKQDEKNLKNDNDHNNQNNINPIIPESSDPQFLDELITKCHRRFTLYGHQSAVYSISISPDNQYLISGSYDSTIRLWNLHTKTCFGVYKGHFCPVLCVKFSPICHYFASGGCDKTARLWAINSGGALRIFVGHLSDVELVDFHPNGLYLVTSANDKTIRLWIIKTGECCRIFVNYSLKNSFVDCMCFSNSGKLLAVAIDRGIIIYDLVKMGDPVSIVSNLTNKAITSVSFDNDDNVIVCCTEDYKVNFYDIDSILNSEDNLKINNEQDKKVELIYSYVTKKTTILQTKFTNTNLMLMAGRFDDNDPKIFN